jgi:hypothetical protein
MARWSHLPERRSQGEDDAGSEAEAPGELPAARVGWLAAWTAEGLFVDFAGNAAGPLVARSLVPWQPAEIQEAVESRRPIFLLFENADERRPVIVGAVQPIPKRGPTPVPPPEANPAPAPDGNSVQVTADGQRLEVAARDEIVLRCGEASITLRRNGRVVIKGAYVETRARGTNRIKGGNVLIN